MSFPADRCAVCCWPEGSACLAQRLGHARICEHVAMDRSGTAPPYLAVESAAWAQQVREGREPGSGGAMQARAGMSLEPGAPGLIERIKSGGKAIIDHAIAGFPNVPEAIAETRLATCRACEFMTPIGPVMLCQKCGCVMQIKVYLPTMACPIGKWHAESS